MIWIRFATSSFRLTRTTNLEIDENQIKDDDDDDDAHRNEI